MSTGSCAFETLKPGPEEDLSKVLMIIFTSKSLNNSSYCYMKAPQDLGFTHHSPTKQMASILHTKEIHAGKA